MKCSLGMFFKILNVCVAAFLAVVWTWRWIWYLDQKFLFWNLLYPVCIIFFLILLLIREFKNDFTKTYFQFLHVLLGLGFWNIFLGCATVYGWGSYHKDWSPDIQLLCYIGGCILWGIGLFYVFFHFLAKNCNGEQAKKEIETEVIKA